MSLRFYSSETKKNEEFNPIDPNEIKIYSCGPTVYQNPHIGNWRYFLFVDFLSRFLQYNGYKTLHIMNLTDIDDKTIAKAYEKKISLPLYTEKYIKNFFQDLKNLKCLPLNHYPKATEHIPEMIDMIKKLTSLGYTYQDDNGSIYFRIRNFKNYGAPLIQFNPEDRLEEAIEKDEYQKEAYGDFALWKAYQEKDGDVYYQNPEISKGRPGWHIECSAIILKYLGEQIDIHTGGVDNKFPHHVNEIAQTEACTQKKFVKYFIHIEHLILDDIKMSKSLNNVITLEELMKQFSPLIIRFTLIRFHYRHKIILSQDLKIFKESEAMMIRFLNFYNTLKKYSSLEDGQLSSSEAILDALSEMKKKYNQALDQDMNISEALGVLFKFIKFVYLHMDDLNFRIAKKILIELETIFLKQIFGEESLEKISINDVEDANIKEKLNQLIQKREYYRQQKNYKEADNLRNQIMDLGYQIDDTDLGAIPKKIN